MQRIEAVQKRLEATLLHHVKHALHAPLATTTSEPALLCCMRWIAAAVAPEVFLAFLLKNLPPPAADWPDIPNADLLPSVCMPLLAQWLALKPLFQCLPNVPSPFNNTWPRILLDALAPSDTDRVQAAWSDAKIFRNVRL